jgi:hypothetical protein
MEVLNGREWTQGILATLGVAVFCGWLLATLGEFGVMLIVWGGLLYGLAVAETALRATGRKRGLLMEILVGVCGVAGILAGWLLEMLRHDYPLEAHLTNPWSYALILFAGFIAVSRVRSL